MGASWQGRTGVLLVFAAAAFPAAADAGPRADYSQAFTTPYPGRSAGTDTHILYKRPGHPKAKPIPVRREVFIFPAGTRFDGAAAPVCKASDLELELIGKSACPAAAWVGRGFGDTFMTGWPGDGEKPFVMNAWNDGAGLVLLAGPKQYPIRFAGRAHWRGRVITATIPRSPGGPPDGDSALRRLHHVIEARSRRGHAFARTPPRCPASGVWTFRARFTFADGVSESEKSTMRCKHRKRPHHHQRRTRQRR